MDSQQDFLRPARHPFYVKKPIVIDGKHADLINNHGFQNNSGKQSAYSVDLSWYGYGKRRDDQLSEPAQPYSKNHSVSLRDVFEKAILSGGVPIDSPDDENTPHRNPSFITSSLPRQQRSQRRAGNQSPPSRRHPSNKGSTDYFLDSSSESETESSGGRHNDAYVDDVSSTISDEMFKSPYEEPRLMSSDDDHPHIRPLPLVLDVSDNMQASRSALSGLFKPKFKPKDGSTSRSNVHRNPVWDHNEVMGSTRRSMQPNSHSGKLPRTPYPLTESVPVQSHTTPYRNSRSPDHEEPEDRISHDKYLPSQVRSSRRSPRLSRTSPRLHRDRRYYQEDEDNPDEIRAASPHERSRGGMIGDGAVEQMQIEDPPWVKERARRIRKRRRCCIISAVGVLVFVALVAGILGLIFGYLAPRFWNNSATISDTNVAILNTTSYSSPATTTTTTSAPTSENITLAGVMRITNLDFTRSLEDSTSTDYQNLSTQFCSAMDNVFNNQSDSQYQGCRIDSFSEGSVKTYYQLNFKLSVRPDDPEDNPKERLMNWTKSAILRSVEVGEFQPSAGYGWEIDSNLTLEVQSPIVDAPNTTTTTTTTTTITTEEPQVNSTIIVGNVTTDGDTTTVNSTASANTTTVSTTIDTTNGTSVAPTTTTVTTTTQQRSGSDCPDGMRLGKTYIDPMNCTRFKMCTKRSSEPKVFAIPCTVHKMYVQNDEHNGTCEVCNEDICDLCTPPPSDGSENKTTSVPTSLSTIDPDLVILLSQPSQTITTITITPNATQSSSQPPTISLSNSQTSIINQSETSNAITSTTALITSTMMTPTSAAHLTVPTTIGTTTSVESALCNARQPSSRKTIPVTDDCTKFVYCNNSTSVMSECQCEQMFDPDESKCVACNFEVCGECKICNF